MAKESKDVVLPPGVNKGVVRDNLEVVCFAIALIFFFKTFVGQQFTIPTGSMRDTLMIGDHLLINKFIYAVPQWDWEAKLFPMRRVERGDIIVFRYPVNRDQDYVKRCVAKEGDRVELREKRLYVNGKLVTGPWEFHRLSDEFALDSNNQPIYVNDQAVFKEPPMPGPWPETRSVGTNVTPPSNDLFPFTDPEANGTSYPSEKAMSGAFRDYIGEFTIPKGFLLALGDNRENSQDSRFWGFVPMDHLRGRPFLVWWSFREGGRDDQSAKVPDDPTDVLKNFADGAQHFFTRTRWDRTGYLPR